MSDKIQQQFDADGTDETTREILKEMEAEKGDQDQEEAADEEQESAKDTDEAENADGDDGDTEEADGDQEQADEEEEGGDEAEAQKVERDIVTVPIWTHKKALKEKDKEIQELKDKLEGDSEEGEKPTKQQQADFSETAKQLAEKHGGSPELIAEILKIAKEQFGGVPADLQKTVKKLEQERKVAQAQTQFVTEFDSDVLPLIQEDAPNADQKTVGKVRNYLKQLAFTKELHTTPLRMIYLDAVRKGKLTVGAGETRKTTEKAKGGKSRGDEGGKKVTPENANADDIRNMSDEEFDAFVETAKKQPRTLRRGGQPVK